MIKLKIVLDTNALLRSVSRRSSYAMVLDKLFDGSYDLIVTNPILLEYEEKITEIFSAEIAGPLISALLMLPNVTKVDVHFHLNVIPHDQDDNKFSDAAFAGNAHYIVTDDKHFQALTFVDFPHLQVIALEGFKSLLQE